MLKLLRYLFITFIILIITSLALTQIKPVKDFILHIVVEKIEETTGYVISVKNFTLTLPFEVNVQGLTISENSELLASIESGIFRVQPASLFKKQLTFQFITLNNVFLERLPAKRSEKSHPPLQLNLHELPCCFSLPSLHIKNATLAEGLLKELPFRSLDLDGAILLDPIKGLVDVNLDIYEYRQHNHHVQGHVKLTQSDDMLTFEGAASIEGVEFLTFSENLKGNIFLKLNGSRSAWSGLISEEPFKGEGENIVGSSFLKFQVEGSSNSYIKEGDIKGSLTLSSDRSMVISDIKGLIDATIPISGSISLDQHGNLDGSMFEIFVNDIDRYKNVLPTAVISPPFSLKVQLFDQIMSPRFHIVATSEGLELDYGILLDHPSLILNGRVESDKLTGNAQILFSSKKNDLVAKTAFSLTGSLLNLTGLSLTGDSTTGHGDLIIDFAKMNLKGDFRGDIADLKVMKPLIRYDISGKSSFRGRLSYNEEGRQHVYLSIEASNLTIDNNKAHKIAAIIDVNDIYNSPDGTINVKGSGFKSGDFDFDQGSLQSTISPSEPIWPFEADVKGKFFNIQSSGSWSMSSHMIQVIAEIFTGDLHGYKVALTSPVKLIIEENAVAITPFEFKVAGGSLSAKLDYNSSKVNLDADLKDIPIPFLLPETYSQAIDGVITAEAHLYGKPSGLLGHVMLNLKGIIFEDDIVTNTYPLTGALNLTLLEDEVKFEGNIVETSKMPIEVKASMPITFMLTAPLIHIDMNKPIDISMNAKGPITPFLELFPSTSMILTGSGDLGVNITGTANAPIVRGEASLSEGSFESYDFGTVLKDIKASFSGEGNKILINTLSAHDTSGGTLEGKGFISLEQSAGFPFDLSVALKNLQLIRLDNTQARFDGTVSLAGNKDKVSVTGNLESTEATYSITSKIDEITKTVDVIYINQEPSEKGPTLLSKPVLTEYPITLEVDVVIPGNLKIGNDDFNSKWRGDVKLSGDINKIEAHGSLSIVNGTYMLNGQQYEIRQGTISFGGVPYKNINVYVVTSREIGDYRIDIVLQGPISNPKVILRSSPPLPQQGVLSLILFGKASSDISAYQDQELEESLSNLTKGGSGPGIVNKIQKTIGVDSIDFKRPNTDDRDDMSIQLGKYLTKDIFISLNKGFGEEANKVALEAKLKNNFKLKIEAGDRSDSDSDQAAGQISLIWKHDY